MAFKRDRKQSGISQCFVCKGNPFGVLGQPARCVQKKVAQADQGVHHPPVAFWVLHASSPRRTSTAYLVRNSFFHMIDPSI